ncbi:MAG: T9SS type A sorting domain-containing protein [Bacteroidota bacterium]
MIRFLHLFAFLLIVSFATAQVPVQVLTSPTGMLYGHSIAIAEDGSLLAIGRFDQNTNTTVMIYKLVDGKYEFDQEVGFTFEITAISISSDNSTIIVGETLGNVHRPARVHFMQEENGEWYVLNNKINDPASPQDGSGYAYAVSNDGRTIAMSIPQIDDGEVYVYRFNEDGTVESKGSIILGAANEWRFGERIGISGDGNRLSISSVTPQRTKIFDFEDGEWVEKAIIDGYYRFTVLSPDGESCMVSRGKEIAIYKVDSNGDWLLQGSALEAYAEVNFGWNILDAAFFPETNSFAIGMLNASNQTSKFAVFDFKEGNWIERRNPFYDKTYDDYSGVEIATTSDASLIVLPSPQKNEFLGEVSLYNDLTNASLKLAAFHDKNENGIMEDDEDYFSDSRFIVNGQTTLYGQDGFTYATAYGLEHEIIIVPSIEGMATTTDSVVTFSYTENQDREVLFGLKYLYPIAQATANFCNNLMLCNTTDNNFFIVRNIGSVPISAKIDLVFELAEYQSSSVEPSTVTDTSLFWDIDMLMPGQSIRITTEFQMPDETFTGQVIPMKGHISLFQEGFTDPFLDKEVDRSFTLRCSYDPNDKAVFPEGIGEDLLTLINQDLTYRIRFQNTGNFPAQHVVVEDVISEHLDLNSLHLIETSHRLTQMSQNGRNIKFVFENIMLPDSVNNEPESHGHIFFSIRPNSDIEERTIIENTADIFFDLNAPIITNTTISTMVSSFPGSTSTSDIVTAKPLEISPNPASDLIHLPESLAGGEISLFDYSGKLVKREPIQSHQLDISDLQTKSVYYMIIQKDGAYYSGNFVKN